MGTHLSKGIVCLAGMFNGAMFMYAMLNIALDYKSIRTDNIRDFFQIKIVALKRALVEIVENDVVWLLYFSMKLVVHESDVT